jgi:hypothetical protein
MHPFLVEQALIDNIALSHCMYATLWAVCDGAALVYLSLKPSQILRRLFTVLGHQVG